MASPSSEKFSQSSNTAAAADDTAKSYKPKENKKDKKIHFLANGYVTYKVGSSAAERKAAWQHRQQQLALEEDCPELKHVGDSSDKAPQVYSDTWLFYNTNLGLPIQLYAKQVGNLIRALPEAYAALAQDYVGWLRIVGEGKTQLVYLKVEEYKEQIYLFLKKDFKRNETDTEWTSMPSSNVSFDPAMDDPAELLAFMLHCRQ